MGQLLQSGATVVRKWGNYSKVVQRRNQIGETGEGNRFWQRTAGFVTDFPDDRQCTTINFWEAEFMLKSKERRNDTTTTVKSKERRNDAPTTVVPGWLVRLRNNYLEVLLLLKTDLILWDTVRLSWRKQVVERLFVLYNKDRQMSP